MFYIIDCFTGWLLEVDLGVNIGSFIHLFQRSQGGLRL